MSLAITNKDAAALRNQSARYDEDGSRPRLLKPERPEPRENEEVAQALLILAQSLRAQAESINANALATSNLKQQQAVLPSAAAVAPTPPQPRDEEWVFEHTYDQAGDIIKTTARRVR